MHEPERVSQCNIPGMVSTIITSYNKGPYLHEAIESALSQDYEPHEILVIDDGSTDDTRQVAASFGDRIRYVGRPNGGQSSAENHGIRLARGELIAFLDGDDRWRAGKLRKQVDVFRQNRETSVVYTRAWTFDHATGRAPADDGKIQPLHRGMVLDQILAWNFIPFSSAVARRDCLMDAGMFDETVNYGNDYDLWLRVARKHTFDFVDEELMEYRVGIDQFISRTNDAYDRAIALQRRFVQRFYNGRYPRPEVMRRGIAMKCAAHGDKLLGQGRQLHALAAHMKAACLEPWSRSRWGSVLRDFIPNSLAAQLKAAISKLISSQSLAS